MSSIFKPDTELLIFTETQFAQVIEVLSQLKLSSPKDIKLMIFDDELSITEYIQGRRMSQTEHLLIDTDFTMGKIAQMSGYSTSSRFAELLKKVREYFLLNTETLQRGKIEIIKS